MVGALPLYPAFLDPPADPSPYLPVSRLAYNEIFVDPDVAARGRPRPQTRDACWRRTSSGGAWPIVHSAALVDYEDVSRLRRQVLVADGRIAAGPTVVAPRRALRLRRGASRAARLRPLPRRPRARDRTGAGRPPWPVQGSPFRRRATTSTRSGRRRSSWRVRRPRRLSTPISRSACTPKGSTRSGRRTSSSPGCTAGLRRISSSTVGRTGPSRRSIPNGCARTGTATSSTSCGAPVAHASYLRVDHVMGLQRLYWIPEGFDARHGAYVSYRADELHAVVSLEAHRAGSVVVGEDLGTVPAGVRERMTRGPHAALLGPPVRVDRGGPAARAARFGAWPRGAPTTCRASRRISGASTSTRTSAPGSCPRPRRRAARGARALARRHARRRRQAEGRRRPPRATEDPAAAVLRGCLAHLARSPADLVMVDLEELWGEREPQNRPGTGPEAANWRRRASHTLEEARRTSGPPSSSASCTARARPDPPRRGGLCHDRSPPASADGVDRRAALSEDDLYLFNEGTHRRLGEKLGAHLRPAGASPSPSGPPTRCGSPSSGTSTTGVRDADPLELRGSSGIWEGAVAQAASGPRLQVRHHDPGRRRPREGRPVRPLHRASAADRLGGVGSGLRVGRRRLDARPAAIAYGLDAPLSVYEVHLGSWRRDPADPDRLLGYTEVAEPLIDHVRETGFTHVEFLPLMEHPFYGSWGYQTTGFFAPTRRYGTPQDLMFLIDQLHQAGIGVLFDWVPSHFPDDAFALASFDGTHLYEHADPRLGLPPGLEEPDLQLRPPRGAKLPGLLGRALAVGVPRRRAAGRRGGLHALPRLLPAPGGVDPERPRGTREPRGHRVPPPAEHRDLRRPSRRPGHRRGVDRLARGLAPGRTPAASASASSGTWAGCTTRCSTWPATPSIAATTTTS